VIAIQHLFDRLDRIIIQAQAASHICLFLDYDGTLVGIKKYPSDARPSIKTKIILSRLISSRRIEPVLVSGRPVSQLESFFGDIEIGQLAMIGSHGAEIRKAGKKPHILEIAKKHICALSDLKQKVLNITGTSSCFYVEDKTVSLAIHYRNCPAGSLDILDKIRKKLQDYTSRLPLEIIEGKKVIEVKSMAINKGTAIKEWIQYSCSGQDNLVLCIGDDVTDEFMFEANRYGLNIKVAAKPNIQSVAPYYLRGVGQVQQFLLKLIPAVP